jgi:tetratricopeptide (TPR) repeat protein
MLREMEKRQHVDGDSVINLQMNLAFNYFNIGQHEKAIAIIEKQLDACMSSGSASLKLVIGKSNVATLYSAEDKLDQAESLWQEVLDRHRKYYGPKGEATARALSGLGNTLLRKKRFAEAEKYLLESIAATEDTQLGRPALYSRQLDLGEALFEQKKYAEAEAHLLKGHEGLLQFHTSRSSLSRSMPQIYRSHHLLIRLYEITNQDDKAREWQSKLPTEPAPHPRQKTAPNQLPSFCHGISFP